MAALKREGYRITNTGAVIPPPDFETFRKDYPNARKAR